MSRRGVGARLLRVEAEAAVFAPLIDALAAVGRRCGWLDLATPPVPPPDLETAAGLGALRAVAAGGGWTVAVKRVKGALVLRDLLREHFAGCDLVLVKGEVEAAALAPSEGGFWVVKPVAGDARRLTTEELARRLRRPGWPEA